MSSNPPPARDPSDDWQLPEEESPAGKWETEEAQTAARSASAQASAPVSASEPASAPAIRPAAGDWLRPISEALRAPFGSLWNDPRGRPLILVTLLALVGVCALSCFILSVALLSNQPIVNPGPGPTAVATAAPTAALTPAPTLPVTAALIINANQTPIPPGVPNRLTIGNATFDIIPLRPDSTGQWQYDHNAVKTAYWAVGTLVNYVIGLPATSENRATFDALQPNDLLVLDTGVGTLRYRAAYTQTIKADEQAPLRDQLNPQMTLMLLGESGDQRTLLIAQYTDEGTANSLVSVGVPINLGDVRVKVINTRLIPGTAVGLSARNVYQVNIQVTNLVTRIIDASQFVGMLADGAGNRYSLSTDASFSAGGAGWTQGALMPGNTLTATGGYEVPLNMPGPRLEWTFTTESANPYVARVSIPYEQITVSPTPAPTEAPVAEVTLLNVNITPEGNELRIVGTVRNLTSKFLPVSLRDISLGSNGNLSALNASLPAFPWSITPGETLAFQLTFARPAGGAPAIFTMFGQSFEISGL
jgi:hypothetical protein